MQAALKAQVLPEVVRFRGHAEGRGVCLHVFVSACVGD
jgi:hypothetical protein